MASNTLKLSDKGSEYPSRFGGNEVTYATVEPVPGDAHATLDRFLADFVAQDATAEEQAQIVADYLNGYGITYRRNGIVKRTLNGDDLKDATVEDALKAATDAANGDRITPTGRTSGKTSAKKKVEEAEAKAAAKDEGARTLYLGLSASQRKQFRPMLIAQGTFTEAELEALDAEAAAK